MLDNPINLVGACSKLRELIKQLDEENIDCQKKE